MSTNVKARLGLTPIYVRLAASYLQRGVGSYPCDNFGYDTAKVISDRGWNNYALEGDPPAYFMEMRVEFYSVGKRMKWVEFKINMTGGGSSNSTAFTVINSDGDDEHDLDD